jgi:hypothetical protein
LVESEEGEKEKEPSAKENPEEQPNKEPEEGKQEKEPAAKE